MKIRFLTSPPGRSEYKAGDIVDFRGKVEEGYAQKYIDRGWAEAAGRSKAAVDTDLDAVIADKARADAEAKAKADAEAKAKAEAEAKAKIDAGAART